MGLERQKANQTPKPMPVGGKSLKPVELCSLAKSWSELEDRKRIIRMKGLPKAVEVKEKSKASKPQTFSE